MNNRTHLYCNNQTYEKKRYLVATSTALLIATGVAAATAGTSMAIGASQQHQADKDVNSRAQDAQNQAKAIEASALESEALAEEEAKDAVREKLAKQTRTVFTSNVDELGKNKTTFGA